MLNYAIRLLFGKGKEDHSGLIKYKYKTIKSETKKAWQIEFPNGSTIWLPKSKTQIKKRKKEIQIPKWLAKAKHLEIGE